MKNTCHILLILLLFICLVSANAQELSLAECYKKGEQNSPLLSQLESQRLIGEANAANKSILWKPQLQLNGRVSIQSEVTELNLDLPIPGFVAPEISKDWYKIYLDVTQTIYDGGLAKSGKETELIKASIEQERVKVNLFEIRARINGAYFAILSFQQQIELAELRFSTLKKQKERLASAVENGMQHESELLLMEAEMIKASQVIVQLKSGLLTSYNLLSILIGEELNGKETLTHPVDPLIANTGLKNSRPELQLFDEQKKQLEVQSEVLQKMRSPKVYAFGQAGYGRPGLNVLDDSFNDWYVVGVGVNWKVYDWQETKRKKQVLNLQTDIIESNTQNFLFQLELVQKSKWDEINSSFALIETDKNILDLYRKVEKMSASRLENGFITSSEYLTQLNAAIGAELNMTQRKLNVLKLKYEYLTLIGFDYENAKY